MGNPARWRLKEGEMDWESASSFSDNREDKIKILNERIKVLEDTLRPMLEVCKDPKSYDLVRVSEIISKALEVKP